ncbi:hypothetical protein BOTBODRAFT_532171 [Botryobasidium botryosum FD-172 SS1]|uniref:Uncharacterized protein n=1 Tax=Botryobasidium botryosum (strain FD-172 SS1) TaxID=930990 RepID=A0A067MCH9_BOTB1|nr:hypothetical protein BOTBODRAFT_532171 [Botryobasidium botryosum FD-172 SS1]
MVLHVVSRGSSYIFASSGAFTLSFFYRSSYSLHFLPSRFARAGFLFFCSVGYSQDLNPFILYRPADVLLWGCVCFFCGGFMNGQAGDALSTTYCCIWSSATACRVCKSETLRKY